MYNNYSEWASQLKPLTPNEFLTAEESAAKLVRKKNTKKKKIDFNREGENQFKDPIFILLIFILLLVALITMTEAFKYVGQQAILDYEGSLEYGLNIPIQWYVMIAQIGYWSLAEITMIVSMIFWRQYIIKREKNGYYDNLKLYIFGNNFSWIRSSLSKLFDLRLFIALLSMSFIFLVNLNSEYHWLMKLMIPLISISIGLFFEEYYSEWSLQRKEANDKYKEWFNNYQRYNLEPQKHPQYQNYLMSEVWRKLSRKNKITGDEDISGQWKYAVVQEQMSDINWYESEHQKHILTVKSSNVDINDVDDMSDAGILRELVEQWVIGENPILTTNNFTVNMKEKSVLDHVTNEKSKAKTISGLKKKLTTLVNKGR